MVQRTDAISTFKDSNKVTSRLYSGLMAMEDGVTISEDYLGHQMIISFEKVTNTTFPHIFVSAPEQIVTRELKDILRETSPVWADSSDELVCFVCKKSKNRQTVYSVPAVKYSESNDLHLVRDMDENQICTECIEEAEDVVRKHIEQKNLQKDFLATTI